MIDPMPIDRFHQIVASYGADPDRWPDGARAGAVRCLTENEAARAAWRDAAETDDALDALPEPEVTRDLLRKVAAYADAPSPRGAPAPAHLMRIAVPYAAAAALALVIGLALPSPLRDAPAVLPQTAAADAGDVDAERFAATTTNLTALALIDGPIISDGNSDTDTATIDIDPLLQLPLL